MRESRGKGRKGEGKGREGKGKEGKWEGKEPPHFYNEVYAYEHQRTQFTSLKLCE